MTMTWNQRRSVFPAEFWNRLPESRSCFSRQATKPATSSPTESAFGGMREKRSLACRSNLWLTWIMGRSAVDTEAVSFSEWSSSPTRRRLRFDLPIILHITANITPLSATGGDWSGHGTDTCLIAWKQYLDEHLILLGAPCRPLPFF